MSALELISRLKTLGIRLALEGDKLRVDAPNGALTVDLHAELARRKTEITNLLQWSRRSNRSIALPLERRSRDLPPPLSYAQQRLWFLDQLEPGNSAHNISWTVRIKGSLNRAALQSAVDDLVSRHEVLRTSIPSVDGKPLQKIVSKVRVPVEVQDMTGASDERLRACLARLASSPFELGNGPLLRITLLQIAESEHVLLVLIHHIISDGGSMRVMFRELAALYEGYVSGQPVTLTELPVQYADYAMWQREWLTGDALKQQLDYWTTRLSGAPDLLELPTDRPRSAAQRFRGASVLRVLPRALANDLRTLGRGYRCTLFMVMLAAFKVLLNRYSGCEDLVVGTPISGRSRTALESLIGFFVNTVVLRSDLSGDPSFAELMERVRSGALEAHSNQELPFEKLVEALQPKRMLSYSPIFQVMFDLQEEPRWQLPIRDLEVFPEIVFSSRTSTFDLTLSVRESEAGLDAMFEYDTDLFDETTIERLASHYQILLEAVVAEPDRRISAVPLLTETERQQVAIAWNAASGSRPKEGTLHGLFESQVAADPDAIALVHGEAELSYGDLNRWANQLARKLQTLGVVAETRVGLCAGRSPAMVAGMLGVLKAGGCYVPLDPDYPVSRLRFMLADADVAAVLVQPGMESMLPETEVPRVILEPEPQTESTVFPEDPRAGAERSNLACIYYTSGSSGQPKGVMLEHGGLVNYTHQIGLKTNISPADRVLQFASISFDIALEEIFTALTWGATLVLRDRQILETGASFFSSCQQQGITWISLPTAYWHMLASAVGEKSCQVPAALRVVIIGGEKARAECLAAWRAGCGTEVRVINTYGPTETSVAATWHELTYLDPALHPEIPIGSPLPNTCVYVLDRHRQAVPLGVPGELYIGGIGVARGYLNRDDTTAERFRSNPFGEGRLYQTGDRARQLPDGRLVFVGRTDEQVKLRGHRIEPGEIEAALGLHPSVDRSVVVAREDVPGNARLVAYVVTAPGQATEPVALRAHLKARLPAYMVPAAYVELAGLPLTANGKVDRGRLPAPVWERHTEQRYVAPRTPVEHTLVGIWAELLGVTKVGVHDDFFDLGGHSLLATQLMSRVRDALAVELPLRSLFNRPTVAGLADELAGNGQAEDAVPLRPRDRAARELPPLSYAQQRLWFLDQLEPDSAAYHLHWAASLAGPLQPGLLQQAVDTLVARHESLRTTFAARGGEPVQVIVPEWTVPVELEVMTGASDERVRARLIELARQPFDLHRGPLLRVVLLRVDASRHVLLLLMHHIVSDGWSMGVLFRELTGLYDAYAADTAAALPELPVQYADYAVWQREWLSGDELKRQVSYWKSRLAGIPPLLELPLDRPRPVVQRYRGAWCQRQLSAELLAGLQELARSRGCTLFMVLLAAFNVLLARYTGREDVVVGTPIAGRKRTELESLIGFFLNTLVLRTDVSGNPSFAALLERVKHTALEAYEHQELPFEKLVEELQPVRNTSHTPIVQVMFNLHNEPHGEFALHGLKVSPFNVDRGTAKFDLTVAMVEGRSGLSAGFEYNTDLFEAASIEQMLAGFETLLAGIVADPNAAVAGLPLLSAPLAPALQPQVRWQVFPAAALDDSIVARFERQAVAADERPAVVTAAHRWSYRELNRRANGVAHGLLAACGDGEQRVGLLLGHDAPMLAGLLGALKAGKAYVPLDPGAPPARLRQWIKGAGLAAVVIDREHRETAHGIMNGDLALVEVDTVTPTAWSNPGVAIPRQTLAYILFTSGSSGAPKGVMQTHRNVLHHIRTYTNALHLHADDRVSLLSPYGFDAAVMDIFGALLNGACLCPLDLRTEERVDDLLERLSLEAVTVLHATPTVYRYLLQQKKCRHDLSKVRLVVLGGEEARATDFELFKKHFAPPALFVNGLGPSESTLALQYFADHQTRLPGNVVPLGSPVADTEVRLLDEAGQPAGICGEIGIRSAYVTPGYWNAPALTRAALLPDPDGGDRPMYRSGDRARQLPDGRLVFVGRTDEQVKLRGHRIEPGEIEAALGLHPSVDRSVVVAREDVPGNARLVAYVVTAPGQATEPVALRAHLKARLPAYMVPAAYVELAGLPLTANGKVDRGRLPAPVWERHTEQRYVAPRTPVEHTLVGIWAELLGVTKVGVHDDFFDLGGHSLLATQLMSRVRDALAVELPLRSLFNRPTVAGLADELAGNGQAEDAVPLRPRDRAARELPPLSYAQQRLWFLDQLEPDSAAYHLHWAASLAGPLQPGLLQQAVDTLVARHESLRTTFAARGGEPVQVIVPEWTVPVELEVMTGASDERVRARLIELARQPFDLHRGPLLRVVLLRVDASRHVLLLLMHHIVSDGWSMGVLFRELTGLYDAYAADTAAALPELPVQYADYAVWQREWLSGDELKRQVSYWKSRLAGIPPLLELPLDRPRPVVQRYRGAWCQRQLSAELLAGLQELARSRGCTLFMVLLAAFNVLLARYTGREDVVVGTPIAGRKRTELESLIGFFLNTLVLRTDVSGNPSFAALLERVKHTALEAYEHQELPFEKLVEELQPVRNTSHTPIVQVMFNLHNEPHGEFALHGLKVSPFNVDRGTAKFDLTVAMVEGRSGLSAGFEYNTDLFEAASIEQMLAGFETLLAGIVADPNAAVAGLPLLSAPLAPALQPQVRWQVFPAAALDDSIVARFERQAVAADERPAVVTAAHRWSYRELNRRANGVAHGLLAACGDGEQRVGLLLGHDAPMLAGLLGALKAGKAYVPLDPGAPPARLRQWIKGAGLAAVVIDREHRETAHGIMNGDLALVEVDTVTPTAWSNPGVAIPRQTLAYILFTSGSSGAPKGVMQTHRNVLHHIRTYTNALHLHADDRVSLLSPYGFDAAVMDIFGALLNGACLCPLDLRTEERVDDLLERLSLEAVTVLHATPTVYRYLLQQKKCRHDLSKVRLVVLGGEEARATDFELFKKHFAPPALFVNGLGPSESTLALQYFADHQTRLPGNVVPLGSPVADTEVRLLDEAGQPAGICGEIGIRSAYVTPGYWNAPALTRAALLPDPDGGDRPMYRSGDRARQLPDGRLVFVGRTDEQVKLRGHRIEPGEIEAALGLHPSVDRSVVVAREDVPGNARLVAYVVTAPGQATEPVALRAHLKARLPAYMVPAAYVELAGLPLTANGKVDRGRLPAPVWERHTEQRYVAPRTPVEHTLVGIWAELLGVTKVGVHDDFFDLGGHSLLATQLMSRVSDSMQVGLPLRRLFDGPTVAAVAQHIEAIEWALQDISATGTGD